MDLAELMKLYVVELFLELLLLHVVISEIINIELLLDLTLLHLNIPLLILQLLVLCIDEGHKVRVDLFIPNLDEFLPGLVLFPECFQLEVKQFVSRFLLGII